MKKLTLLLITVFVSLYSSAQRVDVDVDVKEKDPVKNINQIKLGFSGQIDVYYFGRYDYYYDGYDRYDYPDGGNLFLYAAYEHIWEFPNKIAIALEPKIGVNFRLYSTHGMIGNDTKFYWANREFWRMGIALSTDYIIGVHESTVSVPMDGGNYHQRKNVDVYYHNVNIDIALIPFQFRFKNSPVTLEAQFGIAGISILTERSENYSDSNGDKNHFSNSAAYPYFLKGELKLGFILP